VLARPLPRFDPWNEANVYVSAADAAMFRRFADVVDTVLVLDEEEDNDIAAAVDNDGNSETAGRDAHTPLPPLRQVKEREMMLEDENVLLKWLHPDVAGSGNGDGSDDSSQSSGELGTEFFNEFERYTNAFDANAFLATKPVHASSGADDSDDDDGGDNDVDDGGMDDAAAFAAQISAKLNGATAYSVGHYATKNSHH
jgi:hypothetical protein